MRTRSLSACLIALCTAGCGSKEAFPYWLDGEVNVTLTHADGSVASHVIGPIPADSLGEPPRKGPKPDTDADGAYLTRESGPQIGDPLMDMFLVIGGGAMWELWPALELDVQPGFEMTIGCMPAADTTWNLEIDLSWQEQLGCEADYPSEVLEGDWVAEVAFCPSRVETEEGWVCEVGESEYELAELHVEWAFEDTPVEYFTYYRGGEVLGAGF